MLCPQSSKVSLQEHPEILALLQDEGFRQELKKRPEEVLESLALHLEPKAIPDVVNLPEVADVQTAQLKIDVRWYGLI